MAMRLQRYLAQAGVASRRKAEDLILAGRVAVNGKIVTALGVKVDAKRDRVDFDRRRIVLEDHVWILLNKPDATVSTVSDPEGRRTVLDVLGETTQRVYPVGRLDYHTQGALLLTNDGDLANALAHPRFEQQRTYHVKLRGQIPPGALQPLRDGVILDTGERVSAEVMILGNTGKHTWIEMTIRQGLNHQIHRMAECIDKVVLRLIRVSFAGLTVEGLRPGEHRHLSQREINELRTLAKLPGESKRDNRPRRRAPSPRKKAPARKKGAAPRSAKGAQRTRKPTRKRR